MRTTTIHACVVRRAAELVGGPDVLAARLNVPAEGVLLWMSGELPTPPRIFTAAIDIFLECSLADLMSQARAHRESLEAENVDD